MKTKTCFKCNIDKALSEYYKHPQMGDGHLNKCKICTKKDTKNITDKLISTPEGLQKERKRHRDKYFRLGYKDLHKPSKDSKKKTMDLHKLKYPEKVRAKSFSYNKIKPIIKGNQLHHWSYNKEHYTDTIELSITEHNKLHRYIIYDQERMMYRRCDNLELLDTKEKHLEFYNSLISKP